MTFLTPLLFLITSTAAYASTVSDIFARPVIPRVYAGEQYALAQADRREGNRVNITTVASTIASLKPSYVCSIISVSYGDSLTSTMISDFNTIRDAVRATSPNAKFDIQIELTPQPINGRSPFPNAAAVITFMESFDSQLKLDGWWFDFYSTAQKQVPDWVVAVNQYAYSHNQTVGGNVFGNIVPPGADAVSFVDDRYNISMVYDGFGIDAKEVNLLKQNASSTILLGHLNNNPQNGNSTESCTYMWDWNSTRRADYLNYWSEQQSSLDFTFMLPIFFPLCPGAFSFNPLVDSLPAGVQGLSGNSNTLFDYLKVLSNVTTTATTTTTASVTSTSTTSTSTSTTSTSWAPENKVSDWLTLLTAVIAFLC